MPSQKTRKNKAAVITKLNANDVLCGRGSGASEFTGSKRFRDLCNTRKEEYLKCTKNAEKDAIAKALLSQIKANGGRFLELQDKTVDASIVSGGTWVEISDKKAVSKVKQNLRQRDPIPAAARPGPGVVELLEADTAREASNARMKQMGGGTGDFVPGMASASLKASWMQPPTPPPSLLSVLPPMLAGGSILDPRLAFLQPTPPQLNPLLRSLLVQQQQQSHTQLATASMFAAKLFPNLSATAETSLPAQQELSVVRPPVDARPPVISPHFFTLEGGNISTNDGHATDGTMSEAESTVENAPTTIQKSAPSLRNEENASSRKESEPYATKEDDDDVSEFLMSVLQLSGLPRFTDVEKERASMSDEEKAAALSDMFGKYCSVDTHTNKKARRDLDDESIAFLVKHMRAEIDKIPNEKKQALLEAQAKCEPDEFSDARLERFLRCVGMDATVRKSAMRDLCLLLLLRDVCLITSSLPIATDRGATICELLGESKTCIWKRQVHSADDVE